SVLALLRLSPSLRLRVFSRKRFFLQSRPAIIDSILDRVLISATWYESAHITSAPNQLTNPRSRHIREHVVCKKNVLLAELAFARTPSASQIDYPLSQLRWEMRSRLA